MNLPLGDPVLLAQDIPETLTARLRSGGQAVCMRFSHRGDLLASGTAKGTIAIFDLETNGVARKLKGHTAGRTVQSLSWERSGRYLLSSSVDWKVILWDLQDGSRVRTVNLGAPVYIAELHPANYLQCVAALYEYRPVLADFTDRLHVRQLALPNLPRRAPHEEGGEKADAKHFTTVAAFTPTGSHIITGTTKGWLNVISSATQETVYSTRLCSKPILLIRLSSSGRDLLVNASDTIILTITLSHIQKHWHSEFILGFDSTSFGVSALTLKLFCVYSQYIDLLVLLIQPPLLQFCDVVNVKFVFLLNVLHILFNLRKVWRESAPSLRSID